MQKKIFPVLKIMHSFISLKSWKKYIKRLGKRKLKSSEISSVYPANSETLNSFDSNNTHYYSSSFEKLSLYSKDSLEEKSSNSQCCINPKSSERLEIDHHFRNLKKKSVSVDSLSPKSIRSDTSFSDDSLRSGKLSPDSLSKPIKHFKVKTEQEKDITISNYSLNKYLNTSEKIYQYDTRLSTIVRSQSVSNSYKIHSNFLGKVANKCGKYFYSDDHLNEGRIFHSCSNPTLTKYEAVSRDSFGNANNDQMFSVNPLKQQNISLDSLNEEIKEVQSSFKNNYNMKSISIGILPNLSSFENKLKNRYFFNGNKRHFYNFQNDSRYYSDGVSKNNPKLETVRSFVEALSKSKYEQHEEDTMSIDSLSCSPIEFNSPSVLGCSTSINNKFDPEISQNRNSFMTENLLKVVGKSNEFRLHLYKKETLGNKDLPNDQLVNSSFSIDSLIMSSNDFYNQDMKKSISSDSLNDSVNST